MDLSDASFKKLAYRAGVKTIADGSVLQMKGLFIDHLRKIISTALIVNDANKTKTLMPADVQESLAFHGFNVTPSCELLKTKAV